MHPKALRKTKPNQTPTSRLKEIINIMAEIN
jgi:hypothetical protein